MNVPPIVLRHPSLRWLVPAAVACVAGLAATGVFNAQASSEKLPRTSPSALIAAVQSPELTGFSGTVVSRLSLGLPELPSIGNVGNGASLTSLLSGSHTLQVWYGGEDQQRIALLGATDETDLFRTGRQVWQWSSADRVAVHTVLPKQATDQHRILAAPQTLTPSDLSRSALEALDPSTRVTVQDNHRVANRSAYELVLRPRAAASRIGAVHISIDGKTKVPLGVQVYPRGSRSAAVDVAFTSIRFAKPADTYFDFSPPQGAEVHRIDLSRPSLDRSGIARRLSVIGSGWSAIASYRSGHPIKLTGMLRRATTAVHGSWGHGRLLESDLLSVLITGNGRVFAGAVDPDSLYAAAASE